MGSDKFWVFCVILGIKKHVLKLGISMVTSKKLYEPVPNQTEPSSNQKQSKNLGFDQYWAWSDIFCVKNHVLKLENPIVTSRIIWTNPKPKQIKPEQKT